MKNILNVFFRSVFQNFCACAIFQIINTEYFMQIVWWEIYGIVWRL